MSHFVQHGIFGGNCKQNYIFKREMPRNSANKQERLLELVFILAQITMIPFNKFLIQNALDNCTKSINFEYQQNPYFQLRNSCQSVILNLG